MLINLVYSQVGLGEIREAYASLREVPDKFELVDVFRAPEYVDQIVEECIALGAPAIWFHTSWPRLPEPLSKKM